MKDSVKKLLIFVGVVAAIVVVFVLMGKRKTPNYHDKYDGIDLNVSVAGAERQGTYAGYLRNHTDAVDAKTDAVVDLWNYQAEDGVDVVYDYYNADKALVMENGSLVTWKVNVPESGFYNIYLEFLLPESRGVAAERAVMIDGELPFDDAQNIVFTRIWVDNGKKRVDNQGNEIRPSQKEIYEWQKGYCKDSMGYVADPYKFYLEKGAHTLSFRAVNEPMALKELKIAAIKEDKTYAEYAASNPAANTSVTGLSYDAVIQGEDAVRRSESSLYAKYDHASPITVPYSVTKTILNYTGGDAWKTAGQWIEWEFTVPEDGYYKITIKGRQNYARGSVSSRMLYIDGEIPFKEMKEVSFDYKTDWECKTLSDENGEPYMFYLTGGTHTLRLEATLGGVGKVLEELGDSTFRLNQIYRKILVYTGATPDKYRDYDIHKVYPEAIQAMDLESKRLYKAVDDMVEYTGQKAEKIATAQTLAKQLERFVEKPQKITTEFTTFKDNITSLGTSTLEMSETKLDIDYIRINGADAAVTVDKTNFFKNLAHEVKAFGASFFVDYDKVGDIYDDGKSGDAIKVWILTGRDQGSIMKTMVDDTFTAQTGIKVNVEIVAPNAVLNAVMAGKGPNAILSIGGDQPVNYALRGAAVDLTQFDGFEETFSNFTPSSYAQYSLDGAVYGMPETQTFNVLFYRKDILSELGYDEPPKTWKELIEMFPTIQGNNMNIGIPSVFGATVGAAGGDLNQYFTMLYQYGGDLYNEKGTKTTVDTEAGVEAFADYVKFFNDYGVPIAYDFVSRFRSGEMPIAVANYGSYNTLVVSAPEIRGLWDFTLVPGTERVDENGNTYIDHSDCIVGSASMMIPSDEKKQQDTWKFLSWWASTETQVRFGREMEALLGASARYATANKNAFCQLAWTTDAIEVLTEQWENTVGIREVPGGYYTGRHLTNAVRKCINFKEDPREAILDYTILINEELTKKREEFGLPTE